RPRSSVDPRFVRRDQSAFYYRDITFIILRIRNGNSPYNSIAPIITVITLSVAAVTAHTVQSINATGEIYERD
ncbi:hypothetical protein O6474_23460, partial [Salmonella enterica subsp. enterica]